MTRTQLITIAQAAARLGVAPSTLRRQAHDGRISAIRPGHDYLVTVEETDRYGREQARTRPTDRPTEEGRGGPGAAGTDQGDPVVPSQKSGILRAIPKPPKERNSASNSQVRNERNSASNSETPQMSGISRAIPKSNGSGISRTVRKPQMSGFSRADSEPSFGASRPAPKPRKK